MMEYSLPHAILALLREEATSTTPKSYFIRSGARSTKITLIYSKRKKHDGGDFSDSGLTGGRCENRSQHRFNGLRRHSKKYDSQSSDGSSIDSRNSRLADRVGSFRSSQCPTDSSTLTTTSNDSQRMRPDEVRCRDGYEFNSSPTNNIDEDNNDDEDDDNDEYSNQYIALSPSCYGDEDKPLTPGRDLHLPGSPRPPTPNLQNYDAIFTSANNNQNITPSRQPTIEYDNSLSPPRLPVIDHVTRDSGRQGDTHANSTTSDNPLGQNTCWSSRSTRKSQKNASTNPRKSKSLKSSPNAKNRTSDKGRNSLSPAPSSVPPIIIQAASPQQQQPHQHHPQYQHAASPPPQPHQHHPHHQHQHKRRSDMDALSVHNQGRHLQRIRSWDGGRR